MCEWPSTSAGNHRLPGKIDARGAGRRLHVAPAPDAREVRLLDEKSRILYRRAAITRDETGAFIQGRTRDARCLS